MNFEAGISPQWIEAQYLLWRKHPDRIPSAWRAFFEGFELGTEEAPARTGDPAYAIKQSGVQSLIYRYRDIGHLLACTDPLNPCPTDHPLLSLAAFDLGEEDLDTTFHNRRFLASPATLREILAAMRETYCRSIGVEFMHIQEPKERQWLIDRMEPNRNRPEFSTEEKKRILRKLEEAALFEAFLHRRFLGQKRFSLEGGEVLIPLLDKVVRKSVAMGVSDLVLGMSHRGRLNVLVNIFGKPLEHMFAEFEDNVEHHFVGEGDVKYHKGFSTDLDGPNGDRIHITLASNPSHLESVDPVVEGKCRARQEWYGEGGTNKVLPVLVHGDAAFAGQGMVAEVLNLSQLEGYRTGGTLHIVLNNQIGFTTSPEDARSTRYATDVAKMLMVPIFHVHGDDPEAVVHAASLALDWRQRFGRDAVLEILCYRRHGHNEGDEPYFTQPLMYEKIKDHPPVHEIYAERLRQELAGEEIDAIGKVVEERLEQADGSQGQIAVEGFSGKWGDIERKFRHAEVKTAVAKKTLVELGRAFTTLPEEFHPHPKIVRIVERNRKSIESGEKIDWAAAEALAFASLLREGVSIRLSGQDSRRGTFNQRHSTLYDVETGEPFVPLAAAAREGAAFRVYDSMLSEAAVLGFEYGYSLESPYGLTLWEAQFGDFANGAQVIIDQFIVSSATKWDRVSGLVMLLPHGYEGQGPEHSSARIERFLQLCADNNIQVVYPSTPAQYFHLLRRQVRQPFRRPLVVFTPKSLLRLPACRSSLGEFVKGEFREVLPAGADPKRVKKVLLCTGKIYFDLSERKEKEEREDVAIVRIEQLYPLHAELLREAIEPFGKAESFTWVQEEPRNMGAWSYLRFPLEEILGRAPAYIGRDEAASTAVGSHRLHNEEQEAILAEVFKL
ncbi:2-oxoglutarate dehydrogenase E1 component [Desulfuromonas sp. TF]|uniref:2-oxoglutarate dehydrogenase E1 component n=1 Tax=Desulfuromonas sp. TF TaxID=1232410 RepID=UPI0003F8A56D|nr:2-oxoglutarate dehydrogenase E1 component [Desulfuromonas sp. TF]